MVEQLELWPNNEEPQAAFANYPKSLAEHRALSQEDGRLWKPRDALISVLRDIDQGVSSPELLIAFWKTTMPNGDYKIGSVVSGGLRHELIGVAYNGLDLLMKER